MNFLSEAPIGFDLAHHIQLIFIQQIFPSSSCNRSKIYVLHSFLFLEGSYCVSRIVTKDPIDSKGAAVFALEPSCF